MKYLFLFALLNFNFFSAQVERSKKFQLSAGTEYRITPFNFGSNSDGIILDPQPINYNRDEQLSGLSINVGLEWFFHKKTSFGIIQTFRYDQIFNDNVAPIENLQIINAPHKQFITDTEISLKRYFPLNNSDKIFASFGYSIMNQNTYYTTTTYFNGSTTDYYTSQNWFKFHAYKIGIGYQYKSLEISTGLYICDNASNFSNFGNSAFGMPFLKLNYNIVKF